MPGHVLGRGRDLREINPDEDGVEGVEFMLQLCSDKNVYRWNATSNECNVSFIKIVLSVIFQQLTKYPTSKLLRLRRNQF